MEERGRPEPTATATATHGFFLPALYVIHTVGPIVKDSAPSSNQRNQLATCYSESIQLSAHLNTDSIAFCAISTGVFGYPKEEAAHTSLEAIATTINSLGDRAPHVIVVAYTSADEQIYRAALAERGRAKP
jgi:O-acetyl-ADP-ribose deacetylase (regulator of RNase III)